MGMITEFDLMGRLTFSDESRRGRIRGPFDNHDHAADRYARAVQPRGTR